MSDNNYEQSIHNQFGELDPGKFTVQMLPPLIFLCGGAIRTLVPESLRERILNHLDDHDDDLFQSCVIAERFSDYFRDGAYTNLMQFEEDIANISTLITICLESPGSLVEFGMFCNHPNIARKLLAIAPTEQTQTADSFIYLGPLTSLRSIDTQSVIIYPWPTPGNAYEHIDMVVADLKARLGSMRKTESFNEDNSGHIALLIHDIIAIAEPIKAQEIEWALAVMNINSPSERDIARLLYLLGKMNLVRCEEYSHVKYYFTAKKEVKRIKFGATRSGRRFDRDAAFMAIRQSFCFAAGKTVDEPTKKRLYVAKRINEIRG